MTPRCNILACNEGGSSHAGRVRAGLIIALRPLQVGVVMLLGRLRGLLLLRRGILLLLLLWGLLLLLLRLLLRRRLVVVLLRLLPLLLLLGLKRLRLAVLGRHGCWLKGGCHQVDQAPAEQCCKQKLFICSVENNEYPQRGQLASASPMCEFSLI